MVLKVGDDRQLQAAVLAFKLADRGLRKEINDATRTTFNGPWRSAIATRARTPLESRVLVPGARVAAGNPPVFVAATSKRRLRGGLVPDTDGAPVEFGFLADREITYDRRSPKGNVHQVTRHTRRQLPRRRDNGPVMGAVAEFGGRAASLWVQLIVKTYYDAAEGR